jgi:hypothetical protein
MTNKCCNWEKKQLSVRFSNYILSTAWNIPLSNNRMKVGHEFSITYNECDI